MDRIGRKVKDKALMKLLGRFLRAGVVVDGRLQSTLQGIPQGSLCKASHNPPYAKKVIMQSNLVNSL